jgi:hypothetical protein
MAWRGSAALQLLLPAIAPLLWLLGSACGILVIVSAEVSAAFTCRSGSCLT